MSCRIPMALLLGVLFFVPGPGWAEEPAAAESPAPSIEGPAVDSPAVQSPGAERPEVVQRRGYADQMQLESTSIRGNQELPKVMYIVPWKDPNLGDVTGKPVNSLIDEVLAPLDRDVFLRQTKYFDQLYESPGTEVSD